MDQGSPWFNLKQHVDDAFMNGSLQKGSFQIEHIFSPRAGFEPGSSSECLLEFDTRSKPLGHHSRFFLPMFISYQMGPNLFSSFQEKLIKVSNCLKNQIKTLYKIKLTKSVKIWYNNIIEKQAVVQKNHLKIIVIGQIIGSGQIDSFMLQFR